MGVLYVGHTPLCVYCVDISLEICFIKDFSKTFEPIKQTGSYKYYSEKPQKMCFKYTVTRVFYVQIVDV
jgi:hypothetical protein